MHLIDLLILRVTQDLSIRGYLAIRQLDSPNGRFACGDRLALVQDDSDLTEAVGLLNPCRWLDNAILISKSFKVTE